MKKAKFIPETTDLDRVVMSGQELMEATRTVVRTISRDADTTVLFAGKGAYTSGKFTNLPAIPSTAKVTYRQALVTGGYANHESLHNVLTDFVSAAPKLRKWNREGKKLLLAMNNAIEDVRIENGGKDLYNGLAKAIDKTAREVTRSFIDDVYPKDPEIVNNFRRIGPVAVTWEGRRRLGYPDPSNAEAMALLPKEIADRVRKIVDRVMKLPHGVVGMGNIDTWEAHDGCNKAMRLAQKVCAEFEEGEPKEEEAPAGTSDEPGDEEGITLEDDAKSEDVEEGPTEEAEGLPEKEVAAEKEEAADLEEEAFSPELSTAMEKIMGDLIGDGTEYRTLFPLGDKIVRVTDSLKSNPYKSKIGIENYSTITKAMGPQLGTIRRKFERVLVSESASFWEGGKRSGRLKVRGNAAKIIELRPEVFSKRVSEKALNTAVTILVDLSGSMRNHKIKMATEATIAVAEALASAGVPLEILGHTTYDVEGARDVLRSMTRADIKTLSRSEGLLISVFKEFDEGMSTNVRRNLGYMVRMADANNVDGDAIKVAAQRLLMRREERKVMLVLSDGKPEYRDHNNICEDQHTRDSVQLVIQSGIEVAGLGITSTAVRRYYPNYVVVDNIDELASKYIDELAKMILGRGVSGADLIISTAKRGGRI